MEQMKNWCYRHFVTRVPGIRERYLQFDERGPSPRWKKGLYLLWLHIQYSVLLRRSVGQVSRTAFPEQKRLPAGGHESAHVQRETPAELAERLLRYDVISFDVFDTLLLRPFSHPADLFYLVGMELGYPDFRTLRQRAETEARRQKQAAVGSCEVTLAEIWARLSWHTGIPAETGMRTELAWEEKSCFANPYFVPVIAALQKAGKQIAAVSDMYLSGDQIKRLLLRCGYPPFAAYFTSSDHGVSKGEGGLYQILRSRFAGAVRLAHVGDHPAADGERARSNGLACFLYRNVQQAGDQFRPTDLSPITGSLYRGLVNSHLHCGLQCYPRLYEYGFACGGLFVAGYCRFIHAYSQRDPTAALLFLSRDGAVLYQAYRLMYPEEQEKIHYVPWSRLAATKLTASYYKTEFMKRFLFYKTNQRQSMRQIFRSMELETLLPGCCDTLKITPETNLTNKNAPAVQEYLLEHWAQVAAAYQPQQQAAGQYFKTLLRGCRRAVAVDVGWAGSGAMMLGTAVRKLWQLPCTITGLLAGTNSALSPEWDSAEPFLFDGRLDSYLFSARTNRDVWKHHDPSHGHNLDWELLLSAPEGSLIGFYPAEDGSCRIRRKNATARAAQIMEIHRGILDFVTLFLHTEQRMGISIPISGRDACAPMLLLQRRENRKIRRALEALFDEIHIG